ncbi:MAG TPA: uroporphyrinogen decarboxylase family protein [Anaerolineaceae bacterium]|jgi:uroporphyrinogen-III decarboxylase
MNSEFTHWRGFDLTPRLEKLKRTFRHESFRSAEDMPLHINTPTYFSSGSLNKPEDYYTNPASMYAYQADGYEKHLKLIRDDYVPYFMPWLGTGVLASAFGAQVRFPANVEDDPVVVEPCLKSPADVARLRLPDPLQDGLMPRVLEFIDYAVGRSDLPVGLTDMQGPLDTVGLMCGQARLFEWMYDDPKMVHDLFEIVTEAFIQWVKVQKDHIGEPLDSSNGLQGLHSPGIGVWESDDDMVMIGGDLYREFVVPYVSRIFDAFGGGSVHFCGRGTQHIDNLLSIPNIRVVNNSPLGNFKAFAKLKKCIGSRVVIEIQDGAPDEVETYYARLFDEMDDPHGLILATFVFDNAAMDNKGGYLTVKREPVETANRIVDAVRECVRRKLAFEPLLTEDGQAAFLK